jgi:hypothetical protein
MRDITTWRFPFGQPVRKVIQTDNTPKQVFVLGVYASAVHARWTGVDGKTIVNALAVASEPYIFWKGDHPERIISKISIPFELGSLSPANQQFNGPSGIALDELILDPLGLIRTDAWLCDLVPYSYANPAQKKAIERAYSPVAKKYGLPDHSVPPVPSRLAGKKRCKDILDEFHESKSTILILLGDKPIEWFLRHYDSRWNKLTDFGNDSTTYGRLHSALIDGREIMVLPLAHPRQIAKLGRSSPGWYNLHQTWVKDYSREVLKP